MGVARLRLLLLDNYDSFTWNLRDLLLRAGEAEGLALQVEVVRNDAQSLAQLTRRGYDAVVLSPGPGQPQQAGVMAELIHAWRGRVPFFGVCLGHQALGQELGATVVRAPEPVHGKAALIRHSGQGCLAGLPQPLQAMRYHSLVVDAADLAAAGWITATLAGPQPIVMALRHPADGLEGVQFHPESVGTPDGIALARNVVAGFAGRPSLKEPDARSYSP